jgi:hypothetical protein
MKMYTPQKGSQRDHIVQLIMRNGPMTRAEIFEAFPGDRSCKTTMSIADMELMNALVLNDEKKYDVTQGLRRYYEESAAVVPEYKGEIAGPRYYAGFKPWTGAHSTANALRREPIREGFSVKSASVGYPVRDYA